MAMKTPPTEQRVIEVWADTIGVARCTGATCGQRIMWAQVVSSGRRMCFTGRPTPLATRHEGNRLIEAYDFAANHWATCADRQRFKRKRER